MENSNFGQNFELEISLDYFFELQLTLNYNLNYSETYFELDSEEATHCDHCHLICCVYIKGMSRQSIQKIKAMLLCIEYGILFVNTVDTKIKASNAFNAMFVNTVDTGVCGSYRTPYVEYYGV